MLLIPVVTVVIVVCAERENERSESALHSLFGSLSERDLVIEACSFSSTAKPIKSFLVRIPEGMFRSSSKTSTLIPRVLRAG